MADAETPAETPSEPVAEKQPTSKKKRPKTNALSADAWVAAANDAFGVSPEVVRAALSLKNQPEYSRTEVTQAIDAYMKRPVR